MATEPRTLVLIVYAPALVADDGRPTAVVHAMERALPGLRLEWTISDQGQFLPLPERGAWSIRDGMEGDLPLLCNGDERHLVTLTAYECSASASPGGQAQFEVHAELPMDSVGIAVAVDVLEGLAEGARAFWGRVLPNGVASTVAEQFRHSAEAAHVPPLGLPLLELPSRLHSPEIPHYLGWLNYWSAGAARTIGFPDPARDADLLTRARRTATGGWIVPLTEAPLDLDQPAHVEALVRTYQRFPAIGGRSPS
jgi:hypothetical protein